ncbi:ent-kaurene oxidase [Pleurostoma richardsiae]|uniref:Ent-kaurene oxidase n=1 Tax=Pleurostoma richardsiae TaxID=41990 RepID=A0AA38RG42_9PEZI|nr:ent-kaurene oxidase [Pleurostoma richardsiae]
MNSTLNPPRVNIGTPWVFYVTLGAVGSLLFARMLFSSKHKVNLPIVLADEYWSASKRAAMFVTSARKILWKGYREYPDKPWAYNNPETGLTVVIPPKFVDALKSHPALSFKEFIDEDMLSHYTFFGAPPDSVINTIKGGLTPSLPEYVPVLHRLLQDNLFRYFGQHDDWESFKPYTSVLQLVGILGARAWHGEEACRNPEWVRASLAYMQNVFSCIQYLKTYPTFLRGLVFRFSKQRKAILNSFAEAKAMIAESIQKKQEKGGGFLSQPGSMFDLLSTGKHEAMATDADAQTLYQLIFVAVGTITTFGTICQNLLDLADHPEYIEILREEILEAERDEDGYLTKVALTGMKKMDSFMKECARLHGPTMSTFQRVATNNMELPDGTFIPKGTALEAPVCCVHGDDSIHENAEQFDGLRFYRTRLLPGSEHKNQYITPSLSSLNFGYGRHACPGRFLGDCIVKLVLSEVLLNYDIKLPEGRPRAKNVEVGIIVFTDPMSEIMLKSKDSVSATMKI